VHSLLIGEAGEGRRGVLLHHDVGRGVEGAQRLGVGAGPGVERGEERGVAPAQALVALGPADAAPGLGEGLALEGQDRAGDAGVRASDPGPDVDEEDRVGPRQQDAS